MKVSIAKETPTPGCRRCRRDLLESKWFLWWIGRKDDKGGIASRSIDTVNYHRLDWCWLCFSNPRPTLHLWSIASRHRVRCEVGGFTQGRSFWKAICESFPHELMEHFPQICQSGEFPHLSDILHDFHVYFNIHNFHGVWFNDYDWLCVISIRYVLIIVACYVSVRQAHSNLLPHTTAANDSRTRESVAEVSANWDQLTLKHHPLEANAQTGFHDFPLFISATNTRASMYEYRT